LAGMDSKVFLLTDTHDTCVNNMQLWIPREVANKCICTFTNSPAHDHCVRGAFHCDPLRVLPKEGHVFAELPRELLVHADTA
jgi:hypothetical protein